MDKQDKSDEIKALFKDYFDPFTDREVIKILDGHLAENFSDKPEREALQEAFADGGYDPDESLSLNGPTDIFSVMKRKRLDNIMRRTFFRGYYDEEGRGIKGKDPTPEIIEEFFNSLHDPETFGEAFIGDCMSRMAEAHAQDFLSPSGEKVSLALLNDEALGDNYRNHDLPSASMPKMIRYVQMNPGGSYEMYLEYLKQKDEMMAKSIEEKVIPLIGMDVLNETFLKRKKSSGPHLGASN